MSESEALKKLRARVKYLGDSIEEWRQQADAYVKQIAELHANRWAAFTDDELGALDRLLHCASLGEQEFGEVEPMQPVVRELYAEIERRGVDGHEQLDRRRPA